MCHLVYSFSSLHWSMEGRWLGLKLTNVMIKPLRMPSRVMMFGALNKFLMLRSAAHTTTFTTYSSHHRQLCRHCRHPSVFFRYPPTTRWGKTITSAAQQAEMQPSVARADKMAQGPRRCTVTTDAFQYS